MKSVFNKIEKEKSKEIVFPVLAEALVEGETFVALLTGKTSGVVVKGNANNNVGCFCSNFVDLNSEDHWRILSSAESIVLSND